MIKKPQTIKEHYIRLKKILKLIDDETRFRIVGYLIIYRELGLTDLANLLKLSKTAVSRQLNILEKTGIILVKEEKVRGPILKKWYRLDKDLMEIPPSYLKYEMNRSSPDRKKVEVFQYELYGLVCRYFQKFFQFAQENFQKRVQLLTQMSEVSPVSAIPFGFRLEGITESNWEIFQEKFSEFIEKNQDLFSSKQKIPKPAQYGFFYGYMPLGFPLE